jgi:hypothetical protein
VGSSQEHGPAGFGIISRGWSPRLEWAGTFDKAWLDTQWPLLPRNFDSRHNQAAPLDQQASALQTGESVRLTHFTPEGNWQFALPSTECFVWLMFAKGRRQALARLDTLLIEPDIHTVSLTFRLKLALDRGRNPLREIVVGPVTPGILRAIERRKPYVRLRDLGRENDTTGSGA